MTTHLKAHIEKSVNEITEKGCTIPKEILKNYFDTAIALAQATPDDYIGRLITEPESVSNESIKPEEMVKGNWYWLDGEMYYNWLIKFSFLSNNIINSSQSFNNSDGLPYYEDNEGTWSAYSNIRPATQAEVLKYFPNETFNNQTQEYGC